MIRYNELSQKEYDEFFDMIALMDVVVYEDLYRFIGEVTPYECTADCILNPKDKHHREYFPPYKKAAIKVYKKWYDKLIPLCSTENDIRALKMIGDKIDDAKNSVELTWAGMQLRSNISPYIRNGKFIPSMHTVFFDKN